MQILLAIGLLFLGLLLFLAMLRPVFLSGNTGKIYQQPETRRFNGCMPLLVLAIIVLGVLATLFIK